MPLDRLPKWAIPNDDAVRDEVSEFRDMSLADKDLLRGSLARTLARMLAAKGDPGLYDLRDPLPPSTLGALARLRASR